MALKIRLARGGAKKRPFYRIVVAEATAPRDGKFIEKVGTYNPLLDQGHAERIVINAERAQYWLSVGAQPSDRVAGFLATAGLVKGAEKTAQTKKSQPKAKAQERLKEQAAAVEAARLAAEEAKAAAAAAAAPAVEESAPTEEAPAAE
ncbi:MAG: 30S ribosomal protein S16 [Candidatus Paracaedibacteraceae bacterium]|nr:30S ribosomal protein S16 [Candidatus Paracaedibacteraceae bacterium]